MDSVEVNKFDGPIGNFVTVIDILEKTDSVLDEKPCVNSVEGDKFEGPIGTFEVVYGVLGKELRMGNSDVTFGVLETSSCVLGGATEVYSDVVGRLVDLTGNLVGCVDNVADSTEKVFGVVVFVEDVVAVVGFVERV